MNSELSMDQVLIEKLNNILEVNLVKEHFGVKKLAKEVGLSRPKLYRKLQSITGKSTSKFIREYRLSRAMEMLQNDVATASEIAYRVGFSSPTYFNTCFHDHYGYTPGEAKYRKPKPDEGNSDKARIVIADESIKITETSTVKRSPLTKRMVWVNTLGILLLSVFCYYLYSNYTDYFSPVTIKAASNEKSIAMLHFKNLSSDVENQYFADGMMDNILNHLSGIKGLVVKSRQSSEKYRDSDMSIVEIGEELNADYLIEGSLQKEKDSIRIILQLIDAKTDTHVWAENYDFELKQIFKVQSNLSQQIAEELNLVLSSGELQQIVKKPTENLEAYNLYLKGRFFWHNRTEEDLKRSIDYFNQALELDSTYALAYSGLADSYFVLAWHGTMIQKEAFSIAKKHVHKALLLDNDLAEAHATFGGILCWSERNWKDSENEHKLAISLKPSYATAHQWYAQLLDVLGRNKEALEQISIALKLNPNSYVMYATRAMILSKEGFFDEALVAGNKAKEINKNQGWPYWLNFENYWKKGEDDNAIAEMEEWWNIEPNIEMAIESRKAYDKSGIKGVYKYILDYDLEKKGYGYNRPHLMAEKYAFLGEKEKALEWLEKALEKNNVEILWTYNNCYYKDLHDEPRFLAILEKLNLGGYE